MVLSDVHLYTQCGPLAGALHTTRFFYTPPPQAGSSNFTETDTSESDCPCSNGSCSCSEQLACCGSRPLPLDCDGDLAPPRPARARPQHWVELRHSLATPLRDVGQQVWRGSLLMADFITSQREQLRGKLLLELGCGVGLVGLTAGSLNIRTICTDCHRGALALAHANMMTNAGSSGGTADVQFRLIDFLDFSCFNGEQCSAHALVQALLDVGDEVDGPGGGLEGGAAGTSAAATTPDLLPVAELCTRGRCGPEQARGAATHCGSAAPLLGGWDEASLADLARVDVLVAADVIYDYTITEAFLQCAAAVMCQSASRFEGGEGDCGGGPQAGALEGGCRGIPPPCLPVLYVSLEKRFNFTLKDLDTRAVAYDHFLSCIRHSGSGGSRGSSGSSGPPHHRTLAAGRRLEPQKQGETMQEEGGEGEGTSPDRGTSHEPRACAFSDGERPHDSHDSHGRQAGCSAPLLWGARVDVGSIPQYYHYWDRVGAEVVGCRLDRVK